MSFTKVQFFDYPIDGVSHHFVKTDLPRTYTTSFLGYTLELGQDPRQGLEFLWHADVYDDTMTYLSVSAEPRDQDPDKGAYMALDALTEALQLRKAEIVFNLRLIGLVTPKEA